MTAAARSWRHEFWPAWLFYLPLVPWYAYLAARYRGLTVWTAANPAIPAGGVVGESKADILARLPTEAVVPFVRVGLADDPVAMIAARGWNYPVIVKPDVGERGAGVRLVNGPDAVREYQRNAPGPFLAQVYHPGPFEVGIFYYRVPGESAGRIFSITDKVFPAVVGDGRSTVAELIRRHDRYRAQAAVFLRRHAAIRDRVPALGERLPLAVAGNHCQGTLFRDGERWRTPELESAVDRIAGGFDGFFIGRFDVRFTDAAEFRAGRGLAVIELNGATSESGNVYDPDWTIDRAYATLFRQWELLFRIGAANRRRGHAPTPVAELLARVWRYYRAPRPDPLAD